MTGSLHTPPLFIAATLLLWGWQNQQWIAAVIMATVLEAARWIDWRLSVNDRECNRLIDIVSVAFVALAIYQFNDKSAHGIYGILESLPYVLFPIVLLQEYSEAGSIKQSALFLSLRRQAALVPGERVPAVDVSYPYALVCTIAASAGNQRTPLFFIAACLLAGWALWCVRPPGRNVAIWGASLALACGLAFAGQMGLRQGQLQLERMLTRLFDQWSWYERDPARTATAIGAIGRLKLSDRIRVRAALPPDAPLPLLLREATYNKYGYGVWRAEQTELKALDPLPDTAEWRLAPGSRPDRSVILSASLADDKAVVPLPHGAQSIDQSDALVVWKNRYGTVSLESRPGWVAYRVHFHDIPITDPPPVSADLEVPEIHKPALLQVVRELGLDTLAPADAVAAVERFFQDNYTYSLIQRRQALSRTALNEFLLNRRTGHCEYFATATALLLRSVGIPARYAVGYSLQEYSGLEKQHIARARHAHSWTLAHVDGAWKVIDTTPAIWGELEAEEASWWQPLADAWAYLGYHLSVWRRAQGAVREDELLWLLIPLLAWLAWRLKAPGRRARSGQAATRMAEARGGGDSAFYGIVDQFRRQGRGPQPGETLREWLARVECDETSRSLGTLLKLHYRYRFDPASDKEMERKRLQEGVERWLRAQT